MQDWRVSHAWKKCGAQGRKFKPQGQLNFSGHFPLLAIMLIHIMCLFCSWCEISLVMWHLAIDGVKSIVTSEILRLGWRLYLKKFDPEYE